MTENLAFSALGLTSARPNTRRKHVATARATARACQNTTPLQIWIETDGYMENVGQSRYGRFDQNASSPRRVQGGLRASDTRIEFRL
jgi:hypothetical protein